MIELIHKYPLLIKGMLAFVVVAFIGTAYYTGRDTSVENYAAKVGKDTIQMQDYLRAESRMREMYGKMYQNLPPELFAKLGLGKQALDALIERKILKDEAMKQGITVSDDEISGKITDSPNFRGADGRFDKKAYLEVLKRNGLTAPGFEQSIREELAVEKLKKLVQDSVYVNEAELLAAYKRQMATQKKEFKEEEYKQQHDAFFRTQTMYAQERVFKSFIETLKDSYKDKIKVNPALAADFTKQS